VIARRQGAGYWYPKEPDAPNPHCKRRRKFYPSGGEEVMNHMLAIARRVLTQIQHDHRTMALILLVPSLLLIIFKYVFNGQERLFEGFAPVLFGIFPLVLMFIVTSIAMLRERRNGTL